MAITFKKATKKAARLRLGLVGPSGSGKTYTALRLATGLGGRVAVMDSEHGSASKYADEFAFDVLEPDSFSPEVYIDVIRAAEAEGYDVLILDSLSHAWMGAGGALEMVDRAAKRSGGNSFAAWRDVTPLHNQMIEAILGARLHIIATMRSKTEYVVEKDERTGKTFPKKIGMQPVQRDGMEYEFDVVGDIDHEHNLIITKTRCRALKDAVIHEPGEALASTLAGWLSGETDPEAAAALRQLVQGADEATRSEVERRIDAGMTTEDARAYYRELRDILHPAPPAPSGVPAQEGAPAPVPISEPQMRRFWATANEAGYRDDAAVKRMLSDKFGIEGASGLHRGIYEEACTYASDRKLADEYSHDPNQGELLGATA